MSKTTLMMTILCTGVSLLLAGVGVALLRLNGLWHAGIEDGEQAPDYNGPQWLPLA
ncbi:hypothetical protein [Deinococcus hohokamensis]|uniref:Uncharacterized protein n=1 Tax=Deinococcus hohokamensis TaxID=309883 RepID=A0ABV9IBN9_9DEIO